MRVIGKLGDPRELGDCRFIVILGRGRLPLSRNRVKT
jgi:hypothetical protein